MSGAERGIADRHKATMLTRHACTTIAVLTFVLTLLATAPHASAHAYLVSSDPESGAILPVAPAEVRLVFSERLEPESTSAILVDHLGAEVGGTSYRIENQHELIVTLPADLGNGTYSVVYRNISREDGHPSRGYLPFTIGSVSDLRPMSASILGESDGSPDWLRAGSRWLAFSGLLLTLSIWPIWILVLAPALKRRPRARRVALSRLRPLIAFAFALALAGNLAELVSQALDRNDALFAAIETTLLDSRFGELWQMRLLLLGLLAIMFALVDWVWPQRRAGLTVATFAVSLGLAFPFSLNSHAAAQSTGRSFAIAADFLHLISAGLWAGGIVILTWTLWGIRHRAYGDTFGAPFRPVVARFSFVAISAWILLIISGAYAAWLQVGNLDAARSTSYGNAFLLKMGIAAVLLAFGITQFLVVSRRLEREPWNRRLERILFLETIGIVAILLITGWTTSLPPARDTLAQNSVGITIDLAQNDLSAHLVISPGAAGPNHFRLTFGGTAPEQSEAVLRLTPPGNVFDQVEATLVAAGPGIWEAHGSNLSLAGDWEIEAIIRKPGEFQWQAKAVVGVRAPVAAPPGQPWRFGLNALAGLVMLVIGAVAIARTVTVGSSRARKETVGIGLAGLAIGAALLLSARLETPTTFALADDDTITRGSAIYAQQCLACHGVTGGGDGPAAASLPVPPADFTDPIHQLHADSSLATMIQNGFPVSGMPAFSDILSAEEIADVVAYLRALGAGAATVDIPEASDCTIEPRPIESLILITAAPSSSVATDLNWDLLKPASDVQRDAADETVRQFVACGNAGDYERVLATSTLRYLAPQFAALDVAGRDAALERAMTNVPVADLNRIAIESIEPARSLDDGRIATRVVTLDPVNHPHRIEVMLILASEDGIWRIDEVLPPQASAAEPNVATSWPIEVSNEGYDLVLNLGEVSAQGRPLRISVQDSSGQSVDGASGTIALVPRGAGLPIELELSNIDPGVYFTYAPSLSPGQYVAELVLTLPDGTELNTGVTFVTE